MRRGKHRGVLRKTQLLRSAKAECEVLRTVHTSLPHIQWQSDSGGQAQTGCCPWYVNTAGFTVVFNTVCFAEKTFVCKSKLALNFGDLYR